MSLQDCRPLDRLFLLAALILTAAGCGSDSPGAPTTPTPPVTALPADLVFYADPGIRKQSAAIPEAGIDPSGTVHLYYEDPTNSPPRALVATAADGLNFSGGTPMTNANRAYDSRRTLMPDGTWRIYMYNQLTQMMTSSRSTDGVTFTQEAGARYVPSAADFGWIGIHDEYTEGSRVIMNYLGDKSGLNNLRRAVSTDNGVTFTFDRENLLGDAGLGGGGNSHVDQTSIKLPDGRRRMFVMRRLEIFSFITSDGLTYSQEPGTRLKMSDFTTTTVSSLNDPVVIRLPDGRYRMYVAAMVPSAGQPSIFSATTR